MKRAEITADTPPNAVYLRHLVRSLVLDKGTPIGVRTECDRLILAINANSLAGITESVARLHQLPQTDEELRKGLEVSWINQGRPLRAVSGS